MSQNTVTTLIYMLTFTAGITQRIISPQPSQLQNLCPGEEVTITCETRGSPILAWTSDEYIGTGGTQLGFATFNDVGDTRTSLLNPNTIATLINKTNENGVDVLVSTLHIRTLSQFMNPSVSCTNIGLGSRNTTRLHVLGDPDTPQAILAYQTASDSGNCIIHLSWSSPSNTAIEDIAHFVIYINGTQVANETRNANEILFLTAYHLCSCGSQSISIVAVNRCGRSGKNGLITVEGQLPISQLIMECQNSTTTVDCGDLFATNNSSKVVLYNSTLVDSVVEYRCKEGLFPTSVFTATCLENGRWSSNPADYNCGPVNTRYSTSMVNQITLIAVLSSIMVFVLSSVIFFVFGYMCGYKHKQTRTTGQGGDVGHDTKETQPVQQHGQSEVREQDIELNENVAYGPVYHQVCMTSQT